MHPLKIYIAGPYSSATAEGRLAHVQAAIDAGLAVWGKGHWPYIPHLTHYMDERVQALDLPFGYEDYLRLDDVWLGCCDALLYLAPSPGADREKAAAEARGLCIFHAVAEVPTLTAETAPVRPGRTD